MPRSLCGYPNSVDDRPFPARSLTRTRGAAAVSRQTPLREVVRSWNEGSLSAEIATYPGFGFQKTAKEIMLIPNVTMSLVELRRASRLGISGCERAERVGSPERLQDHHQVPVARDPPNSRAQVWQPVAWQLPCPTAAFLVGLAHATCLAYFLVAFMRVAQAMVSEEGGIASGGTRDRAVVLTAERRLLAGLVKMQLDQPDIEASWVLADVAVKDAATLVGKVRELRIKYTGGVAVVLIDPVTPAWLKAAKELRRDKKVAIVVITARPSYEVQRRWRAKDMGDEERPASGMLSLESSLDDIGGSLRASLDHPKDSGYWLETMVDGKKVPLHPSEFFGTEEGEKARRLRSKPDDYRTLLLAGEGLSNAEIEQLEHLADGVGGERLKRARECLGANSNIQLGRIAAELGLFLDASPE